MSRSRQIRARVEAPSVSTAAAEAGQGAARAPLVPSGDESLAVSAVAADFDAGHRLARHRHLRAQLVYAVEGVMTVETAEGLWVVPPLRAVWLPPGVAHSIRMTGRVRMRTLYFDREALGGIELPLRCTVLTVSPLLRELILRVVDGDAAAAAGDGGTDAERRGRVVSVILDELVAAPVSPLEVPIPSDPRLKRITDALLRDPADSRDLGDWARVAAMSERSLARLFPRQTGMTFVRWRQQLRLLRALERLAGGASVTAVALDLGYGSTSAFVRLFRASLGVTPGRYFSEGVKTAIV